MYKIEIQHNALVAKVKCVIVSDLVLFNCFGYLTIVANNFRLTRIFNYPVVIFYRISFTSF